MATLEDVRRIALALPEVEEGSTYGNVSWKVRSRAFAWERPLGWADLELLGNAAPAGPVLALCVQHEGAKQALLTSEPQVLLTTPHFDGYPVVLARLEEAAPALLDELVTDAWLTKAPKKLAAAFLERGPT